MTLRVKDLPTDQQRTTVLHNFAYEVWMMERTGQWIAAAGDDVDIVTFNAFATAHGVHLRNVLSFLFDKLGDGMRAKDLTPAWAEKRTESVSRAFGHICEEIAHLSYRRVASGGVTVHDPALIAEIRGIVDRWLTLLPDYERTIVLSYNR